MADKVFVEICKAVSPRVVTLEEVEKAIPFKVIPQNREDCSFEYKWYAFQYGDLTILVMTGKDTCRIKTISW